MRRYPALQIGSKEPYSGDMTRWHIKNNVPYGVVTAEVTAGQDVVSIDDFAYQDAKWSTTVTGLKAGRAKITVTSTSDDKARKQTFLVEVRNTATLRSGQAYQEAGYS